MTSQHINTLDELKIFLSEIIGSSEFNLTPKRFDDQNEWNFVDGSLSHKSGGFFNVIAIKQEKQERLMLFQPQSALTGLAIAIVDRQPYILVQARVEPGNEGIGQYGPTIQSTPANFFKMHGGKSAPHLEFFFGFSKDVKGFFSNYHLDFGEIYFQKSKWFNYAIVKEAVESTATMKWVSLDALEQACHQNYLINADFRPLLSVFDWDSLSRTTQPIVSFSSDIMTHFINHKRNTNGQIEFMDINKLIDWEISDEGIFGKGGDQIDVKLFEIECLHREVGKWVQPLVSAKTQGLVTLLWRNNNNQKEYLLSVVDEIGIPGKAVITTSFISYPGVSYDPDQFVNSQLTYSYKQSDEGGRFYKHISTFQVREVDQSWPIKTNQYWVSTDELKRLINLPNLTSIQLRNICSVLLKELNPLTFS